MASVAMAASLFGRHVLRASSHPHRRVISLCSSLARWQSTRSLDSAGIADLLSKPTWSVEAMHNAHQPANATPSITKHQLHHLLKLSALPLPSSEAEEAEMIATLEAQLHFVQAVQSVDTTGIEPLQSLRDETALAEQENEIGVDTLRESIAKESTVGFSQRIVRREGEEKVDESQSYDPLAQAPKTIGRYVVVNTKGS